MSFEWMMPYLLVAVVFFLIMKLPGWMRRIRGAQPTFVPHSTYVFAGIFILIMVIYAAVKIIFVAVRQ